MKKVINERILEQGQLLYEARSQKSYQFLHQIKFCQLLSFHATICATDMSSNFPIYFPTISWLLLSIIITVICDTCIIFEKKQSTALK